MIDPVRTCAAGKVEIGAFRTYPQGYKPPEEAQSKYQTIPMSKIEDFGVHANQYYSLDVSFFKSGLDARMLDVLWNKYWVNTLSSSPLRTNRTFIGEQLSDLARKMDQAESHAAQARAHRRLAHRRARSRAEDGTDASAAGRVGRREGHRGAGERRRDAHSERRRIQPTRGGGGASRKRDAMSGGERRLENADFCFSTKKSFATNERARRGSAPMGRRIDDVRVTPPGAAPPPLPSGSRCATRDVPISRSGSSLSVFLHQETHVHHERPHSPPSTNLTTLFATALLPMSMSTSKKRGREWYHFQSLAHDERLRADRALHDPRSQRDVQDELQARVAVLPDLPPRTARRPTRGPAARSARSNTRWSGASRPALGCLCRTRTANPPAARSGSSFDTSPSAARTRYRRGGNPRTSPRPHEVARRLPGEALLPVPQVVGVAPREVVSVGEHHALRDSRPGSAGQQPSRSDPRSSPYSSDARLFTADIDAPPS